MLFISGLLVEKTADLSMYQPEYPGRSRHAVSIRGPSNVTWARTGRKPVHLLEASRPPLHGRVRCTHTNTAHLGDEHEHATAGLRALERPQFVEEVRVTAERLITASDDDTERVSLLYRSCTGSEPEPPLAEAMMGTLGEFRSRFEVDSDSARALITVGDAPVNDGLAASEVAAWTMLVNAVLSSDAVIVKD